MQPASGIWDLFALAVDAALDRAASQMLAREEGSRMSAAAAIAGGAPEEHGVFVMQEAGPSAEVVADFLPR